MHKKLRELQQIAAEYDFVLHRRAKHLQWRHPSGALVFTGQTLSDRRAFQNIRKHFKLSLEKHETN